MVPMKRFKKTFHFFSALSTNGTTTTNDKMSREKNKYLLDKYFPGYFFFASLSHYTQITAEARCRGNSLDGWRLKINRFRMLYFFYYFWILLHFWVNTRALYKAPLNTLCCIKWASRYLPKDLENRFGFLCCVVFFVWNLRMLSTIKTITYFVKRSTAIANVQSIC